MRDRSIPGGDEAPLASENIESEVFYMEGHQNVRLYGYESLFSEAERDAYSTIDQHVRELYLPAFQEDESVDVSRLSVITDIYTMDHPEVFWIDEELNIEYGGKSGCFRLRYNCEGEELSARQEEMEKVVSGFLHGVRSSATDFEKEVRINDFLIDICDYDFLAGSDELYCARNEIHSYGAFADHLVNCEGYAKAAKVLLDRMDINNVLVVGREISGQKAPHIWNAVEIEGDWYYLDVTNNYVESDNPYLRNYLYFLRRTDVYYIAG